MLSHVWLLPLNRGFVKRIHVVAYRCNSSILITEWWCWYWWPQFIHPVSCWRTLGLFPVLGQYEQCCYKHTYMCLLLNTHVHFLDRLSGSGLLGDRGMHVQWTLPSSYCKWSASNAWGSFAAPWSSTAHVTHISVTLGCAGVPSWLRSALPWWLMNLSFLSYFYGLSGRPWRGVYSPIRWLSLPADLWSSFTCSVLSLDTCTTMLSPTGWLAFSLVTVFPDDQRF